MPSGSDYFDPLLARADADGMAASWRRWTTAAPPAAGGRRSSS